MEVIRLPRDEKVQQVEQMRQHIDESGALILTDYRGLSVSAITDLRRKLRQAGAEYKVVKNTLFRLAAENLMEQGMGEMLEGPTAVAFVQDEPVAPAKTIVDFMVEHKTLQLKGGYFEGRVLDADQMKALSKIPPKEILLAQAVGAIQSPLAGLVGTMQGLLSGLVYTLQAISEKKAA